MPRRNSAPVQRQQRRRSNIPRRGTVMTVWDSLGRAIPCTVTYANHLWVDLKDADGNAYTAATPRLG